MKEIEANCIAIENAKKEHTGNAKVTMSQWLVEEVGLIYSFANLVTSH